MPLSVGDLIQAFEFITNQLRTIPPSVGLSTVTYGKESKSNHLRVINTGPATIHGFRLFIHKSSQKEAKWLVPRLSRRAKDVFGKDVTYCIDVPEEGLYVRPDSALYILMSDIPAEWQKAPMIASFTYKTSDGKDVDSDILSVVEVSAT